jgi:hypothetical protein
MTTTSNLEWPPPSEVPSPLPIALHFRWSELQPSKFLAVDVTSLDFVRYATSVLGPSVVCLTQFVAADLVRTHRRSYPTWLLAESLGMGCPDGEHRKLRLVLVRACKFGPFEFAGNEFVLRSHWVSDWSWSELLLNGGTDER